MPKKSPKTPEQLIAELLAALPEDHCDWDAGERIAECRKEAGLSHKAIAHPGCSVTAISLIENGHRKPSEYLILKLALILNVSPTYLAWGHGSKRLGARMQRYVMLILGVPTTELELASARKRALAQSGKQSD